VARVGSVSRTWVHACMLCSLEDSRMAPSARSHHSPRHARTSHADRLKAALIMSLRLLVLAREIRRGGTSRVLARFFGGDSDPQTRLGSGDVFGGPEPQPSELPRDFGRIVQSWDTANQGTELSLHPSLPPRAGREGSGCTSRGI
jgi:hypothetical protein